MKRFARWLYLHTHQAEMRKAIRVAIRPTPLENDGMYVLDLLNLLEE